MNTEINNIISLMRAAFEGGSWHGPAVTEALAGIRDEQAFAALPNTHSIIEIVAHMAAWKKYVAKRFSGDDSYSVTEELNFPKPNSWRESVTELEECHRELVAVVGNFDPGKLALQVPWTNEPFTYYAILHGIIHHDLYHAGQIVLIKKGFSKQTI